MSGVDRGKALAPPVSDNSMMAARRLLPFLEWFPMDRTGVRHDLVAGVTVALVLVPQSMAYAQLAGMPPVYGLYTATLPVLVAALFGSSRQLATGPVAVVSLLIASALTPVAAQGSPEYIALAVALTLLVGLIQIGLGAARLGVLVNFLSHPVLAGFTSAAAIIIGLSQLNKLLGVPIGRSGTFLADVWGVALQVGDAHWPSVAMGLGAFTAMWWLRKHWPRVPGVLIVVAVATAISAAVDFDRSATAGLDQVASAEVRALAEDIRTGADRSERLARERSEKIAERRALAAGGEGLDRQLAGLSYQIDLLTLEMSDIERENRQRRRALRQLALEAERGADGTLRYVAAGTADEPIDGVRWRIQSVDRDAVSLSGGGAVVGHVPAGLPSFVLPSLDLGVLGSLLSTALVIALVGFMEAISIAKAMAARTRSRLDANQELIGQGLANLAGSVTQCFPASGSFSRSAVNLAAGAKSGLSSVVTALIVMATLLFLTPLLYHLPQAVLAAVIMLAVVSLINLGAILHAWRAQRHDGVAGAATFLATLAFAPNLDVGILVGAALSLMLYLYRTMRPRIAVLGRHPDGALRDAAIHGLPLSSHVVAVRFDGDLYFANVPYFEDSILEIDARFPKASQILVVSDGINQIDASGDEVIRHLVERLRASGVTLSFSGLKKQVRDVLRATGTLSVIGADNLFADEDQALAVLARRVTDPAFDPAISALFDRGTTGDPDARA